MSSALGFNLDQSKILSSGNEFMKTDDAFGEKAFSKHYGEKAFSKHYGEKAFSKHYGEKKGEKKLVTL